MICKKTVLLALTQAFLYQGLIADCAKAETLDTYLAMDLDQLMQVTITTVAKKPQALADTAAAVFVITQEDIRRSGATSIPEALALAPGLHVARISASKWSIAARGFGGYTSNKLLVLMDGRSLYTPAYSGTFWDAQNTLLEDVERIEVVRGPGGTIWGANAVNGVINIITKRAQDTEGTLLRAGVGTAGQGGVAVRQGGRVGTSTFARIYGIGSDYAANVLSNPVPGKNDNDVDDDWRNLQSGFRLDGSLGSSNEWTLQGDVYKINGNQIVYPYWLDRPPYLTADFDEYSAQGANVIGGWQHRFGNDDLLTLKSYYDNNKRKESYYQQTFHTLDFDLQYEFTVGSWNNLTSGLGYRYVKGEFVENYQMTFPDQNQNVFSVFLQDQIPLIDRRLWFTLGSKYEHNEFTGSEWQPSARLLGKPSEAQSLWLSVARAVRTPSMAERNGRVTIATFPTPQGTGRVSLLGNSAFEAEYLVAYEVGYRWQARRNLSFDMAAYYNEYEDLYTAVRGSKESDPNFYFSNSQEGTGHGVESVVTWQPRSWLTLFLSYNWQELDINNKDSAIDSGLGSNTPTTNVPEHQAALRSAVDFSERWQGNLWLRYVDSFLGRNSVEVDKQIEISSQYYFDANLIWKPVKNIEIMLAGQNLLNSSQLQYVAEILVPATEIERVVYTKITWSF